MKKFAIVSILTAIAVAIILFFNEKEESSSYQYKRRTMFDEDDI